MPISSTHFTHRNSLIVDNDFLTKPERKNVAVSIFLSMLDISWMMAAFSESIACVDTYKSPT